MILKRLRDAVDHGDTIRAIIRATGSNQDGHTPALVQPSSDAQEQLIRSVYRKAELDFATTRYFEAHGKLFSKIMGEPRNAGLTRGKGTGTPVGDPIEMSAIGRVFRTSRSQDEPLYVYVATRFRSSSGFMY
jgi:acyl transferase domain-containing protein